MKTLGMVMLISVTLSALAFPISGDRVSKVERDGKTIVSLNGNASSTTNEIFTVLDRAGVKTTPDAEGRKLTGRLLSGVVHYLNGAAYGASFAIDGIESSFEISADAKYLTLKGGVAQELFDDMEKADLPMSHVVGAEIVASSHFTCSRSLVSRGEVYHCLLSLQ